jgi:hypothetical protein
MGEIVARLRMGCEAVLDEDLARISPSANTHAIANGTYVFDRTERRGAIPPNTLSQVSPSWGCHL